MNMKIFNGVEIIQDECPELIPNNSLNFEVDKILMNNYSPSTFLYMKNIIF